MRVLEKAYLVRALVENTGCSRTHANEVLTNCDWDLCKAGDLIRDKEQEGNYELPYVFDLMFDIKYMYQLRKYILDSEKTVKRLEDLKNLLKKHNIAV